MNNLNEKLEVKRVVQAYLKKRLRCQKAKELSVKKQVVHQRKQSGGGLSPPSLFKHALLYRFKAQTFDPLQTLYFHQLIERPLHDFFCVLPERNHALF